MAAAAPRLRELHGLAQGLSVVVDRAAQQPQPPPAQPFVARGVRTGDASMFLALLALETEDGGLGGELRNRVAIQRMDNGSAIVRLVKDGMVPELLREPTRPALLRVIGACARGLRLHATAAGGSFVAGANQFAGLLEAFLQQAEAHPVGDPYDDLREAAREIRRRADRFLQTSYTVRTDPLVVAAAEAGQLAAAEEEAAAAHAGEAEEA